jgi:hypothetical protein
MATAIGSFPHQDPATVCDLILKSIPEMPIWPQLPNANFREGMEIQFSEGLPRVVFNEEKKRMYFDTSGDPTSEFEEFYDNYMAENLDHFKISPEFSRGIYEMEKRLKERSSSFPQFKYFKSQVTGPITMGLGRTDENKRSIYYNEMFRDAIVKVTEMKARWLLGRFRFLGCDQICFIDEPILSAFGSSTYVSIQRPDVVKYLNDVIEAIHKENALTGIHCCGNTEWTILVDAGVDIISFDAYEYGETISYYPEKIKSFLENGGILAWGIIPTSEKIIEETPASLVKKLESLIDNLAHKGIDKDLIWQQCLITPSCGTGSRPVEHSEKTFSGLSEVAQLLHQ